MDKELVEEISKLPENKEQCEFNLEEHRFIADCLRMGISIENLKELEYKDVAKIMICFIDKESKQTTKKDIDRLLM